MTKNDETETKLIGKMLFVFCLLITVFCLIIPCNAAILTEYREMNTNSSIHIITETDLSLNYSVLVDNEKLEYIPAFDIIKTGLESNTEHTILIINDNGQMQTIVTKTLESKKQPFYMQFGITGIFALCLILIVIGYLIPMIQLLAIPIEFVGFIHAINDQSAFSTLIFVIMIVVSCLIYAYYGNREILRK